MNLRLAKLSVAIAGCDVILADLLILSACWQARTSAPISSPWSVLPWWIFVMFGLGSACLVYALRTTTRLTQTGLLIVHAITAWCTALVIYRLGFGFDPFIHQAAEQHLVTHGTISLGTPLYIGQYALVWLIEKLSPWSVIQIDQWLVPVLSLGLIPLFQRKQRFLAFALFLLPISRFSFTIPFQLACLPFLAIVALIEQPISNKRLALLSFLALASTLIHPLIGIPSMLVVLGVGLTKTRFARLTAFAIVIGIPLGLLAAFSVYAGLHHSQLSLPSATSFLTSLSVLFAPSYQLSSKLPWLSLVYGFLSVWPFILCLIGLKENVREPTSEKQLRLWTAIGLLSASIILACCVRLPGIIAHEQFEFPLRLFQLVPLLFLPDIALTLERLLSPAPARSRWPTAGIIIGLALISTANWFVSYPQENQLVHRYTPGASVYEYQALQMIKQVAKDQPYLVLSHQMLGAVALQQAGFEQTITTCHGEHLRYALPTGGALYRDLLILLQTIDIAATLERLQTCYGENTVLFIVLPTFLDPVKQTQAKLQPFITSQTDLGGYLNVYQVRKP